MRSRTLVVCAVSTLGAMVGAQEATARFDFQPVAKFDRIVPEETWTPITGGSIRLGSGMTILAERSGEALMLDANGDGKTDKKVQGEYGYVLASGTDDAGARRHYAVRIRRAGESFEYASSAVMAGSIAGVGVELIDRNNNGIWNEVGTDAMVVGGGKAASFLSAVANLGGKLFELEVSADGSEVRAKPYAGETGVLAVRKGLALKGALESAVVSDASRRLSFQVASAAEITVPVGSYVFTAGLATSGSDTARLRAGKMAPLVVESGQTAGLRWGGSLVAEFDYQRDGAMVTVQPTVSFYGRGGEQWHTLLPDAKSPKLVFLDKATGKVLGSKRFEGC